MATERDSKQSNDVVYTFVPFNSFFFCFLRIAHFFRNAPDFTLNGSKKGTWKWMKVATSAYFFLDSLSDACAEFRYGVRVREICFGFFCFCVLFRVISDMLHSTFLSLTLSPSHTLDVSFFHFAFLFLHFGGAVERRTTEHHVLAAIIWNVFSCVVVGSRSLLIFPNNSRSVHFGCCARNAFVCHKTVPMAVLTFDLRLTFFRARNSCNLVQLHIFGSTFFSMSATIHLNSLKSSDGFSHHFPPVCLLHHFRRWSRAINQHTFYSHFHRKAEPNEKIIFSFDATNYMRWGIGTEGSWRIASWIQKKEKHFLLSRSHTDRQTLAQLTSDEADGNIRHRSKGATGEN